MNNFSTAAKGVLTKDRLSGPDCIPQPALIYYTALFTALPAAAISLSNREDLTKALTFPLWHRPGFVASFSFSCLLGLALNYSVVVCTHHNSALTTAVVGCVKNIVVIYLGMFFGGDYVFSWTNFVGLNVSVVGSLLYTKFAFEKRGPAEVCENQKGGQRQI